MSNKIETYFDNIKGKRVAFVGLGRSNLPLIKMFSDAGAEVFACDSREEDSLGANAQIAKEYGATLRLGKSYLDNLDIDMLFRTPGMNYSLPVLSELKSRGVIITSEMELFFDLCPCKIIAVTGSDGKTTTTTIISELLKKQGYNVHLGGNIGNPLMPEIFSIKPEDMAVVELSSFQLISMRKSPHVSVVTNLAPNHLDWHKDMNEYIEAKRNIVLYQNEENTCVLNLDNDITKEFSNTTKASVRFFSSTEKPQSGAYIQDGAIVYTDGVTEEEILKVSDIKIPGHHNVENYMTAICATRDFVDKATVQAVAGEFGGVKHRAQLVRVEDGVKYYNDSIASSPTRTACGMLSLFDEKIILICGGYDKNIPYAPLGPVICEKVKTLILMGATAEKIRQAVVNSAEYSENSPEIIFVDSMEEAVNTAKYKAVSGDIVSLSPASASFDKYRDFEERGNHFISIVNEL